MEELRIYPPWKEAVQIIADRVDAEGYGIVIPHEQLLSYFDLKVPETATPDTWQKHQFYLLQCLENLKDALLEEHSICLLNVRGVGYEVLSPNDQVSIVPRRNEKKMNRIIVKTIKTLTYVVDELLNDEAKDIRLKNMQRVIFLKNASKKKKFLATIDIKRLQNE